MIDYLNWIKNVNMIKMFINRTLRQRNKQDLESQKIILLFNLKFIVHLLCLHTLHRFILECSWLYLLVR